MKVQAILLDLDGTLLGNDRHEFGRQYVKRAYIPFAQIVPFEIFAQAIFKTFEAMTLNTGPRTNMEVFTDVFFPLINCSQEKGQRVLNEFHRNDFPLIENKEELKPEARTLVQKAFDMNYEVVIATNPIFPREVMVQRLKWAGVEDFPYRLITSFENCYASKPNLKYYRDMIEEIGLLPEQCLMVGDEDMDMAAAHIGCKTFLVPGPATDLSPITPPPTYQGSLFDLINLLENQAI